jgi:hypothetical protein
MVHKGFVWECECGNIEYGEYPPQECSECEAIDSFIKVPEDLVEEREAENVLSLKSEEEDES